MKSASNMCVPLAAVSQRYTVYDQSMVAVAVSPAVSWSSGQSSQSVHGLPFRLSYSETRLH